jgi:2-polyprenyl-3-methyl-5-hydroxy-6-metoxy-1,4-benzoquinol methylase
LKFQEILKASPDFEEQNGFYIQKSVRSKFQFEDRYIALRKTEGRIYDDEVVKSLPDIRSSHPLSNEWKIRKKSLEKLRQYIRNKQPTRILEVGCGNGWLIQNLAATTNADCCGMDINATELAQAANLFNDRPNVCFALADIESTVFDGAGIDMVILASVLQYFPKPNQLLTTLKKKLSITGEIHIIDTPLYEAYDVADARRRSREYFTKLNRTDMINQYFHHTWNSFSEHSHSLLYNPKSRWRRVGMALFASSPFPWIVFPSTNISQ